MLEPDMEAFQKRVADTRAQRRMTLEEVAQAAGFTKSHVWEVEKGRSRNPTVRLVWGLANALGVSPAWLLGLDDSKSNIDPLAKQIALMIHREVRDRIHMGAA